MLSPNGPSKLGKVEAGSLLSLRIHLPKGAQGAKPGRSHRHLPQLAAGLGLGSYATQPEDFSACYLNQEDPFE